VKQLLRMARDRADLLALGALLVSVPLLPKGIPGGIYGLGLITGIGGALPAIGVVLVYRSNRIIDFAQLQIGVLTAVLFRLLVSQHTLLSMVRGVCEPCAPAETRLGISITYWLSLVLCLGVAALISLLMYRFVVRRFSDAPRMVLTLATIGVAQFLAFLTSILPRLLATSEQRQLSQLPQPVAASPPVRLTVSWDPAVFHAPEILTAIVATLVIAGLFVYFRRSDAGIAIRASAENRDRASTLGINVERTTQRVWVTAGLLNGVAAILIAMAAPAGAPSSLDVAAMVRILAVVVIASLTSIPLAAVGAVAIGIIDQAVLWAFKSTAAADGVMCAIIGLMLLLQRARASRVEQELAGAWRAAREVRPIPREMRGLDAVRQMTRTLAAVAVVVVLGLPFVLSPTQTNVTTITLIYAVVGLSLLILSGWAGQISLGQFAFAAVGGYVASLASANAHLPLLLCLIVAAVAGAGAAVIVGLPALKMRGLHLAISTLAIAAATTAILLNPSYLGSYLPESVDRGSLIGLSLKSHRAFYYFTLILLIGVFVAVAGLRRSRVGRALIASRDNEAAAQSFSIAPVRARLAAFAMSGGIAALAGALFVFHQFGLKPASFTPDVSVAMFLMVVIGGLGSIAGPLIGAAYLGVLSLFAATPAIVFLATGGGVVVLLLFAPGGLVQLLADVRDAWLRRVAKHHHMIVPSLLADARVGSVDARAPLLPKPGAFVARRYRLDPTEPRS
jgi:branched-chain amino acid transport system permease protein